MADLKSVDDEKACEYLLQPNDIVFARTGASTGRNYFYDGSDGKFVYAASLIKFSIDPSKMSKVCKILLFVTTVQRLDSLFQYR